MYKVTAHNEEEQKYADMLEHTINTDLYPKLRGAIMLYGESVIEYLYESKQYELLFNAVQGKLNVEEIMMDEETYNRLYKEGEL